MIILRFPIKLPFFFLLPLLFLFIVSHKITIFYVYIYLLPKKVCHATRQSQCCKWTENEQHSGPSVLKLCYV